MDPSWADSYAFRFFPIIICVIFLIINNIIRIIFLRRSRLRREAMIRSMNRLRPAGTRILESAVLNAVPVLLYRADRRWEVCAVCSTGFAEDDDLVRVLQRHGHCFHVRCIDTWFRSRTSLQWWERAQRNRVQSENRARVQVS